MKNHPQDGSNRRDRQQQEPQDPRRQERQDLTEKPGTRRDEQRQVEPGQKERRDLSQKPNDRDMQDPNRRERPDVTGKPGTRPEYMTGGGKEQRQDRPNPEQKFPGNQDRTVTERSAGGSEPTRRNNEDVTEPRDSEREPHRGRKYED